MERRIYKYELSPHIDMVTLPLGAKVLSAVEQYGTIVLYALVDPNEIEGKLVEVHVYGTGHPVHESLDEKFRFLNTVKVGVLMFHVFVKE